MQGSGSFDQRLAEAQVAVERGLARWLAGSEAATGVPDRLAAAMQHGVLGGGKRFRPFLVLETARLFGADPSAALDVAAALECVHCYSLVHDDLPAMDNDRLRRGQPTVWAAFDEWSAILAGDALLTLAFERLSDLAAPPDVRLRLVRDLAVASGPAGMVGGQALDLAADKLGQPARQDFASVRRLQRLKTGALIRFAAMSGPILAARPGADVAALADFGDHLGFAFQIADDLLDVTGDAATVGKQVSKDAAAGKATLVSLLGLDGARARLRETEAAAIAALKPFGDDAQMLRAAVKFVVERRS